MRQIRALFSANMSKTASHFERAYQHRIQQLFARFVWRIPNQTLTSVLLWFRDWLIVWCAAHQGYLKTGGWYMPSVLLSPLLCICSRYVCWEVSVANDWRAWHCNHSANGFILLSIITTNLLWSLWPDTSAITENRTKIIVRRGNISLLCSF